MLFIELITVRFARVSSYVSCRKTRPASPACRIVASEASSTGNFVRGMLPGNDGAFDKGNLYIASIVADAPCEYRKYSKSVPLGDDKFEKKSVDSLSLSSQKSCCSSLEFGDSLSPVTVSSSASYLSVRSDEFHVSPRRWFVLGAYCLLSLSASSVWLCFPAVTNILKDYFYCTLMEVNFLSIIFAISLVLFSLPFSYLLDKIGLGNILKLSATFNVTGATIRYFGSDPVYGYWLLLCGNCFSALSVASFLFLPGKMASTWFAENEIGKATATCIAFDALGVGVGFLHATSMISNSEDRKVVEAGLRSFLLSQLIPAAVALMVILVVVKNKPSSPPSQLEFDRLQGKKLYRASKQMQINAEDGVSLVENNSELAYSYMTFKRSLIALLKNRNFHIILHLHGIAVSIEGLYEMMLNEMLIPLYPGYEKNIGVVGFIAVMLGFLSNIAAGAFLDRTRSFKFVSFVIFLMTAVCCTAWLFVIEYFHSFLANAFIIGLLMLCITAYYTVAFAHSRKLSYPVSVGVVGTMLVLTSQIYDTALLFIATAVLQKFGVNAVNCLGAALAVVATALTLFVSADESANTEAEVVKV